PPVAVGTIDLGDVGGVGGGGDPPHAPAALLHGVVCVAARHHDQIAIPHAALVDVKAPAQQVRLPRQRRPVGVDAGAVGGSLSDRAGLRRAKIHVPHHPAVGADLYSRQFDFGTRDAHA